VCSWRTGLDSDQHPSPPNLLRPASLSPKQQQRDCRASAPRSRYLRFLLYRGRRLKHYQGMNVSFTHGSVFLLRVLLFSLLFLPCAAMRCDVESRVAQRSACIVESLFVYTLGELISGIRTSYA
jgi:hypothetical protein